MNNQEKINSLIDEGKKYTFQNNCETVPHGTFSRASIEMQAWIAECEDFLLVNYGESSSPWKLYQQFERVRLDGNYQDEFNKQRNYILSALTACLRIKSSAEKSNTKNSIKKDLTKVFIVHGHDEEVKSKVARLISKLGIEPIILHEQASSGNTIIEKIEEHTDVGFGIAIYTACDVGAKSGVNPELKPRARQNVVFEHGYLIGKIGRNNVCALVKGKVETPNDISGVVYVSMDSADAWQLQIAKELKKSGYNIDLNDLI